MKSLHYVRLLLSLLTWQLRNQSHPETNKAMNDTGLFASTLVDKISPVIFCFGLYVIGFLLASVDRYVCKRNIADSELDNVVSFIAYGILLFSAVESVNYTDEKANSLE